MEFDCVIYRCTNIKLPNFDWDAKAVRSYAKILVGKKFKFDSVNMK